MQYLFDALTLTDKGHRTKDGFWAVRAKAARTGIYDYRAGSVDAPSDRFQSNDTVKVYRDASVVFSEDAVRSFLAKPITNDHPTVPVTSKNWKDHAKGVIMGAMRDGDYLAFDLVLMDQDIISDVEGGKRELSNGYACQLDWTPGVTPDGQKYDARQVSIHGNHVAVVDAGRAGPDCAIKDGERFAVCDANAEAAHAAHSKEGNVPKTITLDGLTVNLGDEAAVEVAIDKLQRTITDKDNDLADAQSKVSTLTGEKAALQSQLDAANAKLDPAAMDAAVAQRAALFDQAVKICPTLSTDGKSDADIMREVVEANLGDAAKDLDDTAIHGAFLALSKATKVEDAKIVPIGSAPLPVNQADHAETIRVARYL